MSGNVKKVLGLVTVLCAIGFVSATAAFAQQPLGDRSASPPPTIQPREEVLPQEDSGTAPDEGQGAAPVSPEEVQQVANQNTDNSLPFTGFVALTLLPVGLALLLAGYVMRRRSLATPQDA